MNNHYYDQSGQPLPPDPELYIGPSPNALSMAALICGIMSLLLYCFGGAIIPAALGILFAFLSRRRVMCSQAKIGLVTSAISLGLYVLSFVILLFSLAVTGILGPLVDKARVTDFSDPDAVMAFQEETIQLIDERLSGLASSARNIYDSLGDSGRSDSARSDSAPSGTAAFRNQTGEAVKDVRNAAAIGGDKAGDTAAQIAAALPAIAGVKT